LVITQKSSILFIIANCVYVVLPIFSIDNYIMATLQQINQAKQVGYENGYLTSRIGKPSGRMTLDTTSQDQFKHNKELSKAWQDGYNKFYQDLANANNEDTMSSNQTIIKVGKDGPFASFYARGKKSKRRGQKKRRTQNKKSRK
jgi:hypothetical protein